MSENIRDQNWRDGALCAETDPDIFHPEMGDYRGSQIARAVCMRCVVLEACRTYGIANTSEQGVIGGLTQQERYRARRSA